MYTGKPGSTGVVTSPLGNHAGGLSPQTVRRITDLRAKWVAPNQALLAKARQLIHEGMALDGHGPREFLPMELYEPGEPEAESEMNFERRGAQITSGDQDHYCDGETEVDSDGRPGELADNVYQLQVENIALERNGFGIGDSGQPGKMFQKGPAGPLSVHSGSGSLDPIGGAKPARLARAVMPTQQPNIFNIIFFSNLVRWFYPFSAASSGAAVPSKRVASVSGPTSHTIKDVL
jgi:hypothetical protein